MVCLVTKWYPTLMTIWIVAYQVPPRKDYKIAKGKFLKVIDMITFLILVMVSWIYRDVKFY